MSNDRIEALTKGHGMLNIAAICAANSITEDVLKGIEMRLTDENKQYLPMDEMLKRPQILQTCWLMKVSSFDKCNFMLSSWFECTSGCSCRKQEIRGNGPDECGS